LAERTSDSPGTWARPSFSAFDSSRGGVQAPCATPLRSERGPVHTVPPVHDKKQSSDRSYPTSEPTGAADFRGSDGFRFSPQQAQGAGSVAREFHRPSPTRKAHRRQSARAHNRSAEGSVTFRHHAGACAIFFLDRDGVITRRVPHPQHPSSRRQPGEQRAPVYSLTRSLTFPSPSAPIRLLPRSLRLPTVTASSRWRRTPTPCGPRCASRPRSTAVIRRTPWHPRFSPPGGREKKLPASEITTPSRPPPPR